MLIPPEARRVLDVGCGVGALGAAIKKAIGKDVEVAGIERNGEVAGIAKDRLDRLIIGDVETIAVPYPQEYFDCIIYGDILEHLINPLAVLRSHAKLLKRGGCVIASIPNIANYRIIKDLKRLRWDYQYSGVLDESHLRFFTIKSIYKMFAEAGLQISEVKRNMLGSRLRRSLNDLCFGVFSDYMTEQYVIKAQKIIDRGMP